MAINMKNYVDISTTFPMNRAFARAWGGLAITASDCLPSAATMLKQAYDVLMGVDGDVGVVRVQLDEVGILFGKDSSEYEFAKKYYNYISPTGNSPTLLSFSRITAGETPRDAFERVNMHTNAFGTFTFLSLPEGGSSAKSDLELLREVAALNASYQSKYLFVVNRPQSVSEQGVITYGAADVVEDVKEFQDIPGVCFVYGATRESAYMPMAIAASTNYATGPVPCFMFKQFYDEDPVVFSTSDYNTLNAANVNFLGRTQTNGQTLDFYQRGYNTNGLDTGIYCNEMWFKAGCEVELMGLISSMERLPADQVGTALVKGAVHTVCTAAIKNGTFSPKVLSAVEEVEVRQLFNTLELAPAEATNALRAISQNGYFVAARLVIGEAPNAQVAHEYIIEYYVFYGTADGVRYIKGHNVLLRG